MHDDIEPFLQSLSQKFHKHSDFEKTQYFSKNPKKVKCMKCMKNVWKGSYQMKEDNP